MAFKVGDVVRYKDESRGESYDSLVKTHTITCVSETGDTVFLTHKDDGIGGSQCDCAGGIHRWRASPSTLELVTKSKTRMNRITTMMKKLLDGDTQTLIKAGFIDGELELTQEGEAALTNILFTANKAELVSEAQAVIDEEEKESKKK